MWTSFDIDASQTIRPGSNTLAVEVFKPWERHFPVRKSLAGFIPYVTCTFGGIWQSVAVLPRRPLRITDLYAYLVPGTNTLRVEIAVAVLPENDSTGSDIEVTVRARIADRQTTAEHALMPGDNRLVVDLAVDGLSRWSPGAPDLHDLEVTVEAGGLSDTIQKPVGLRTLATQGRQLLLNGQAVLLRGVLHWMSYTESIAPYWNPERHPAEMERIRSLGFTLIKQCLVVPPEEYLDHADRTGTLIWMELPMWLPEVDEEYRKRAFIEYAEIVARLRCHPSVVLWTLGCELNAEANRRFLTDLFTQVKDLIPGSPILRDNSGSAEAYGGVELDISDYYDYHFYAEANHFASLIDHFQPGWRDVKPVLFGEYCDSDTLRRVGPEARWWTSRDPDINRQGVRWDMSVSGACRARCRIEADLPMGSGD